MIGQHKPSSGGESYTLSTSVSNLQTSTLMVAISGLEEGFGKAFPVTPVQLYFAGFPFRRAVPLPSRRSPARRCGSNVPANYADAHQRNLHEIYRPRITLNKRIPQRSLA